MSSLQSFESTVRELMPYIEPSLQTRTYVDMDQTTIAYAPPGSKNQLLIYTDGLVGCTATALIGTYPDGAKVGYLQHFHPERHDEGQVEIENVFAVIRQSGALLRAGVVYTPGEKKGLLRPQYHPQYPWACKIITSMTDTKQNHPESAILRTYRSPGPQNSLSVIIGAKKNMSGIAPGRGKVFAKF